MQESCGREWGRERRKKAQASAGLQPRLGVRGPQLPTGSPGPSGGESWPIGPAGSIAQGAEGPTGEVPWGGGPGHQGPVERWPEPAQAQERLRPPPLPGLAGARPVAAEQLRNLFF